jgi:hypothetical protein
VQQLLDVLDLDGVEDLEDLLMLLFRRPVDLTYPQDGSPGCIEVIVHGDPTRFKAGIPLGTELEFPLTMSELASSALTEETAEHIGPWSRGQDPAPGGSQLWAMTPEEQAKALMNALGQLRIMRLLEGAT